METGPPHLEIVNGHVAEVAEIQVVCTLAPDREVWDRQPGEPEAAWGTFVAYRDLEPFNRSLIEAYRRVSAKEPAWHQPECVSTWSRAWRWQERAIAYDRYIDAKMRAALEYQRIRARVETAELGKNMRDKAAEALSVLQSIIYETRVIDGETVRVRRSALTPAQIAQLADVGVKLERLAVGDPTETSASAIGVHFSGQVGVDQLSDEELIERAARIIAARAPDAIRTGQRGRAGLDGEELLHSGSARPGDGRVIAGRAHIVSGPSEADTEGGSDEG